MPSDFPSGKAAAITFYLRGSRSQSYYNKIKNGPTDLKFIMGERSVVATSRQATGTSDLPENANWLITFQFAPPIDVKPDMQWKLLDGDRNKYSAVLLHL